MLLELVRHRALEGVLKGGRRCGGDTVPALGRSPVIVVDCTFAIMMFGICARQKRTGCTAGRCDLSAQLLTTTLPAHGEAEQKDIA